MSIKKSLEENKDEILKNLPEQFHAEFLKKIDSTEEEPEPLDLKTVEGLVEAVLPKGEKLSVKDLSNELKVGDVAASKAEEKEAILKALPEDLKAEFEKNWKG